MTRAAKGRFGQVFAALSVACLIGTAARADPLRIRAEYASNGAWAKATSLDAVLGYRNRNSSSGSLRLMWRARSGAFGFDIQSSMTFAQGDDVAFGAALAPFLPTPLPATLFDLGATWQSNANTLVRNRIERLSVSYTGDNLVLKLGRQAITWGNGMVFHPADIVAPFSPNATDTTYKPGVDMVYGQYLFDSGADLQAIVVPRALTTSGPVAFGASTYAVRGRATLGGLDAKLMLARDRGDTVGTLGLSGALGGASWNAEYIHWALADGTKAPSWLFNISNFGTILGRNTSYFAEIYHNGFGVDAATPLAALPANLTKRMATGQVFLAGRDFLTLGMNIELGADASLAPSTIVNLNDHSAEAGLTFTYTLGDNSNILFSYSHPFGAAGTEFGGRETATGTGIYAGPARRATLQIVRFF